MPAIIYFANHRDIFSNYIRNTIWQTHEFEPTTNEMGSRVARASWFPFGESLFWRHCKKKEGKSQSIGVIVRTAYQLSRNSFEIEPRYSRRTLQSRNCICIACCTVTWKWTHLSVTRTFAQWTNIEHADRLILDDINVPVLATNKNTLRYFLFFRCWVICRGRAYTLRTSGKELINIIATAMKTNSRNARRYADNVHDRSKTANTIMYSERKIPIFHLDRARM